MKFGKFSEKSFSAKIILILIITIAGFCITMFLMSVLMFLSHPSEILAGQIPVQMSGTFLRAVQTIQSFFIFIIPSLLLALFFSVNPKQYLYLNQKNDIIVTCCVIVASLAVIPFINWLAYLNQQMTFPESLKGIEIWMQESEAKAEQAMETMLQMNTVSALIYNIFLIGLLAALGEELLFRGIIQRVITDASKNIHIGIWVAAFIFSAIHLQFYGFIPRMLLGAYFGYLLWWSKSLWMPILAHFVYNTAAVVMNYLMQNGTIDTQAETFGKDDLSIALISFVIFGVFTAAIRKFSVEKELK